MTSFVLVHHHIFKNAGSTLDSILEKNFGANFATLETETNNGKVTQELFLKFLDERKNIQAISSHHFHAQTFESNAHIFFDILFLRDPLDRIRSMYDFHRANCSQDNSQKMMSLKEYVKQLLYSQPHQINDAQVNILANHGRYCRPPDRYDLRAACSRARSASVAGTLELFDESLIAGEYFLSPAFGELDFSYKARNVSLQRKAGLEERLQEMQIECGSQLFNQLLTLNQLDMKLLAFMKKEVLRRIELLPDSEDRLLRFKDRCSR